MIKLGAFVKDTVTGLEGIAIARVTHLYGCVRIGIQPQATKDGKAVEAEWFDEQRVETVRAGVAIDNPERTDDRIRLGSIVYDKVTGFRGMAISYTEYLCGPPRIGIQPQELHEGKTIDAEWFPAPSVELVEEKKPAVSAESKATSGGPYREASLSTRKA